MRFGWLRGLLCRDSGLRSGRYRRLYLRRRPLWRWCFCSGTFAQKFRNGLLECVDTACKPRQFVVHCGFLRRNFLSQSSYAHEGIGRQAEDESYNKKDRKDEIHDGCTPSKLRPIVTECQIAEYITKLEPESA